MSEFEFPCVACHDYLTVEDDYVIEVEGPHCRECAEELWELCSQMLVGDRGIEIQEPEVFDIFA